MALPFNTPITPHEQATFASLMKAFGGPVINPDYLPPHLKANAERILKDWCDSHEMRHWPSWVTQWHTEYTAKQAKAEQRQAVTA